MEDQVYNGIDDYLRYVRRWVRLYDTPLTANSIKEYGSAVWNQWLARRYGRAIVRQAWAGAIHARPGGFSVAAYDSAIRAAGRSDFGRDFARFARDRGRVAHRRASSARARLYPDMPRQGALPLDGAPLTRLLNHTTFQLLRVHARGGRAVVVTCDGPARASPPAWRWSGGSAASARGRTVSALRFSRDGGRLAVRLSRPGRFDRITAVLINADTSAVGFSARRLDWNYLTDTAPFRAAARVVR